MKKQPVYFLVLLAIAAISFVSCKNNTDYRKTKSGLMYKIFSNGKDSLVKPGNILKINFSIKIGSTDSVLQTSYGKSPLFVPIQGDVPADAYSPLEVFSLLHKGDSAVVVQMIDTLLKKNPGGQMPPFFKKGDRLLTIIKVMEVFKSAELATKDKEIEGEKEKQRLEKEAEKEKLVKEKEMEDDLPKGIADMTAWLAKNNINAVKTGKGTFVEIKTPGTGMLADSGKYVTVRYAGKTLADGKVFQSTMDTQSQPYTFQVHSTPPGAIRGWDEGLPLFKKGGKGTLYIPGALAYGRTPPQGSPFKTNEALIFDIDVVDVSDTQPAPQSGQLPPQIREQMQRQQQQQQQKHGN
jgi:FKBP-type peptidyl-prolyl cis-trans isomerase FkpA